MKFAGQSLALALVLTGMSTAPTAAAPQPEDPPYYRITTKTVADPVQNVSLRWRDPDTGKDHADYDGQKIWVSARRGNDHIPARPSILRRSCLGVDGPGSSLYPGSQACTIDGGSQVPEVDHPLKSIKEAVAVANPGDVIIAEKGSYHEQIGWSAYKGSPAPIVLQAEPHEKVIIFGRLNFYNASNWRVRGFTITYDAKLSGNQALVQFSGGHDWSLENNHITGGHGYGNVIVNSAGSPRSSSAPKNFLIHGNCINTAKGPAGAAHGTVHNIYLMASIWSDGGLIQRNLLYGATRGANIKAAGAGDPNESPRRVDIVRNTLLDAASGLVVGLKAEYIESSRDVIAREVGGQRWDAGLKTYSLAQPRRNSLKDSAVFGYSPGVRLESGGSFYFKRNKTDRDFSSAQRTIVGSGCTKRLKDPMMVRTYGHQSG